MTNSVNADSSGVIILIWTLFGAFLGGALSSFGAVVAERVPKGETLGGRSHCACGRQLTSWENIPVVGWLRVRGRTKCCGVKIPTHYVVCEALSSVAGASLGWSAATGEQVVLASALFTITLLGCVAYQWKLNYPK